MRYCQDKDINKMVHRLVKDEGWSYAKGRHARLYPPSGEGFITLSVTPSDRKYRYLVRSQIRKFQSKCASSQQTH